MKNALPLDAENNGRSARQADNGGFAANVQTIQHVVRQEQDLMAGSETMLHTTE